MKIRYYKSNDQCDDKLTFHFIYKYVIAAADDISIRTAMIMTITKSGLTVIKLSSTILELVF